MISNRFSLYLTSGAQNSLKLTHKDFKLLVEAYRRKHLLKDVTEWLGLGMPSEYKSNLFKVYNGRETPKCLNWYVLTDLGKDKLAELERILPAIPSDIKQRNELNEYLFSF